MTDNRTTEQTVTERLRALLDERGVEYEVDERNAITEWSTHYGAFVFFARQREGKLLVETTVATEHSVILTPEQAIAATLGSDVKDCENLLWEFIGALDVADVTDADKKPIVSDYARHIAATLGSEVNGETSDGYHTFNELYHHRAVLFSVIVRDHRELAWKARKHHDGTMYDGMFIVGIETPKGQATYHYDLDPYWEMFDCEEREFAPEWDGHTPDEAIARIAELGSGTCENVWAEFGKFRCSECGLQIGSMSTNTTAPTQVMFCPSCGKAVKR